MGSPGKVVREVTERDLALIARAAAGYRARAAAYLRDLRPLP
jgi:carbonic anhydrase/acetyltransferase-like protein (isoleucine patch superfamily)